MLEIGRVGSAVMEGRGGVGNEPDEEVVGVAAKAVVAVEAEAVVVAETVVVLVVVGAGVVLVVAEVEVESGAEVEDGMGVAGPSALLRGLVGAVVYACVREAESVVIVAFCITLSNGTTKA